MRCSNDGIAIAPPLIVSRAECDTIAGVITEGVKEILG